MAKKNGRRNNKLKKAASTAARASDTGTGPKNAIEQCWYPIFNDREHLLLTDLFKEESLQGDCSACVPMLFNHGSKDETSRTDSNNEFSGETKVIPTWVVINYDHGEDEFYAKALDPDRYVCSSEINHRQLFTLEEVHFSDQQLWLWFWLKEEDLWEQDELLWEEEFGLDGADMRLRKQECLRLLQNGQVNSAWELGKVMARDLLHAAGEDHEDDNEKYWVVDETTGKRTLPAEANIPNMTERFGTQRRFYAICDYRNRGVPKLENENDVPAADDGDGDENGKTKSWKVKTPSTGYVARPMDPTTRYSKSLAATAPKYILSATPILTMMPPWCMYLHHHHQIPTWSTNPQSMLDAHHPRATLSIHPTISLGI